MSVYKNILSKEFLVKEYVENKKSITDISDYISCYRGTIKKYLLKYNISLRNKSEETKLWHLKYPEVGRGKNHSNYNKRGIESSAYKNGKTHNNKCIDCGVIISYNSKRCQKCFSIFLSKTKIGVNHHFYNKKRPEHSIMMSGINNSSYKDGRSLIERFCSECNKKLTVNYNTLCRKCYAKKRFSIPKNNPNWRGGLSFEEYGSEFDNALKEQVRMRDGYKCQLCGCSQLENGRQLDCHHIDYNKRNNTLNNLIALCRGCHAKSSSNRTYWETKYRSKLEEIKL